VEVVLLGLLTGLAAGAVLARGTVLLRPFPGLRGVDRPQPAGW